MGKGWSIFGRAFRVNLTYKFYLLFLCRLKDVSLAIFHLGF